MDEAYTTPNYPEYIETEEKPIEQGIPMMEEKEKIDNDNKEIVTQGAVVNKDPKYFYYIDKDGNVCRKKKGSTQKKKRKNPIIKNYFDKVNLTVPKVMVNGWISKKFKTVRKTGPNGGMLYVPQSLVGKTYQVILIPQEDWILSQIGNI